MLNSKFLPQDYIPKKKKVFTFPSQESLVLCGCMTHGLEYVLIKIAVKHVLIKIAAIS